MHYVWRKYLEPWSFNNQIWCHREGNLFQTNIKNVGRQRDFYKLEELTENEIRILKKLFIDSVPDTELKKLHLGWLRIYGLVPALVRLINETQSINQEDKKLLDITLHNIEEDFHSKMEDAHLPDLASMIEKDLSFYENDERRIHFLNFICLQYFRTKKFLDRMRCVFNDAGRGIMDTKKAAGFMRMFGAANVGASIFREKSLWKLVLLQNQSNIPFITCDQPVMNTYAYGKPTEAHVDDLEFYYPITPELSVLLTRDKHYSYTDKTDVEDLQVNGYNALAVDTSHEQTYGNQKQVLEDLLPLIK